MRFHSSCGPPWLAATGQWSTVVAGPPHHPHWRPLAANTFLRIAPPPRGPRVYVASGTPRSAASAVKRSLTCGETLVDKLTVCDMSQLYAHTARPKLPGKYVCRGGVTSGSGSRCGDSPYSRSPHFGPELG